MNVVVDALNRKPMDSVTALITSHKDIFWDLEKLDIQIQLQNFKVLLTSLSVQPTLIDKIKASQVNGLELQRMYNLVWHLSLEFMKIDTWD